MGKILDLAIRTKTNMAAPCPLYFYNIISHERKILRCKDTVGEIFGVEIIGDGDIIEGKENEDKPWKGT